MLNLLPAQLKVLNKKAEWLADSKTFLQIRRMSKFGLEEYDFVYLKLYGKLYRTFYLINWVKGFTIIILKEIFDW